jgi:flagellar FliL protein
MTDTAEIEETETGKKSKLVLVISLVLALLGGGGGFFAVYSGLLFGSTAEQESVEQEAPEPTALLDVGFVKIDPILISFPQGAISRHLRFSAHLEVPTQHLKDVEAVLPRIVDVLNGYLRALEPKDLEHPAALIKLRSQMLRRVQIVTGKARVRDLLIAEFVLN